MEKGYRLIKCPGSTTQRCTYTIRIKVTEKQYGKKGEVRCPKCDVTFTTVIHAPGITEDPAPDFTQKEPDYRDPLDIIESLFTLCGVKNRK